MNMDEEREGVVLFKKRSKKRKRKKRSCVRDREKDEEEKKSSIEGNEDSSNQDGQNRVALLKAEQKLRKKKIGISTDSLMKKQQKVKKSRKVVVVVDETSKEASDVGGMLSGFSTQTTDESAPGRALMEQYIANKMGTTKNDNGDSCTNATDRKDEESIYQIPDRLKLDRLPRSERDSVTAGGPMAFGTGLAEVELPESFKRKNELETELARREMLERRQPNMETENATMTGNVSVNFKKHAKERAADHRKKREAAVKPRHPNGQTGKIKRSSDDHAFAKFRRFDRESYFRR